MAELTISIIQCHLHWEDKASNLKMFEEKFAALPPTSQVVFLPEMFSTGFSMRAEWYAESMEGETVQWLKQMAASHRRILCGSLIIKENHLYFNRLLWVMPNGMCYHYDKRHLFAYAGEDQHYTAGSNRLIAQVNGWKIALMICYDLRFPVWARQNKDQYDALVYIANWPDRRSLAWKTLLQARAIENQAYVIGVNRIGTDGNDIYYSGNSALIDPLGEIIWQEAEKEAIYTQTLKSEKVEEVRTQFPFLNDADPFVIL
jgi:omega-amidase